MPALQRDDFDMTKLQKSLKQQRQRSTRMRNSVTKLTPAEIRSLNNSIAAAKSSERNPPVQSNHSSSDTPPLTPDHVIQSRHSTSGQSGSNLPTPPRSPDNGPSQRQHLNSTNGVPIHSPVPLSHNKAGFVVTNLHPRPHSASSHRSLPTYRGNEVTRTGSLSMHRPSVMTHQIVENPLSQFSRPRQSRGSGSASPTRADPRQQTPSGHSESNSQRSQSIRVVDEPLPRSDSPERLQESTEVPTQSSGNEPDSTHSVEPADLRLTRSQTAPADGSISAKNPSRFSWNRRRKPTAQHNEADDGNVAAVAPTETKQARRRSLTWKRNSVDSMHSLAYDKTKTGNAPEKRHSLRGDLPSDRTSIYQEIKQELPANTDGFVTHPAVRPLTLEDSDSVSPRGNGKEREQEVVPHDLLADESIPLYSRCSCCGKLKKPTGSRSLSPVLENENIITNFTFEIEKSDHQAQRRRSNSASRQKYTPIIPMVMAEGKTVQARIAPKQRESLPEQVRDVPIVNGRGDIIASGSEPVPTSATGVSERERKVVRFSSLRLGKEVERQANGGQEAKNVPTRRNDEDEDEDEDEDDDAAVSAILRQTREPVRGNAPLEKRQTTPLSFEEPEVKATPEPAMDKTVPDTELGEASGDLMAALSGIDVMFDSTTQGGEGQHNVGGPPPAEQATLPPALLGQLHTDSANQMSIYGLVTSGSGRPSSELEARPEIAQQVTAVTTPKSILKQTKYNDSARSSFDSNSSPVSSNSSRSSSANGGFATRPKITARYMHGSSPEPRASFSPSQPANKMPVKEKTVTIADTTKKTSGGHGSTAQTLGKEATSTTFHPLPVPQLGPHFNSSTSTLKSYSLPGVRNQSNLVQSVLAATKQEPQNDFERALSRI